MSLYYKQPFKNVRTNLRSGHKYGENNFGGGVINS